MTVQTFIPGKSLTLTAAAIRHMEKKVQEKPGTAGIHIGVKPSGCSGYMYVMDLVEAAPADEEVVDAEFSEVDEDKKA